MRSSLFRLFFFFWLALYAPGEIFAAGPPPPNIVLMLADDLGAKDLGCYGASDLNTPNIDALAGTGVRFTQFYVASPVCSPSRAALLTGCYPLHVGMELNGPSHPGEQGGLPPQTQTVAEMLRPAGYHTGLVGKWHLGVSPENDPQGSGFDEAFGHLSGCIDQYSHYFYWNGPHIHDLYRNRQEVHEDGTHMNELIARESRRFILDNKDRPFLLYVPFGLPHYPTQAPVQFREMYQQLPEPRRSYAACVSYLDDAVGRIVAALDEAGVGGRTIVIFLSDNGHSTEERTGFGGGWAGEYRGSKQSLFEGGIRLPLIINWPGELPEGTTRGQLVAAMDLTPTLLEACGVKEPAGHDIDGRSLMETLKSPKAPATHEELHWQLQDQWAVRQGDWKLIRNPRDTDGTPLTGADSTFLVNLATDIGEKTNVAAQYPEIVVRLSKLHGDWRASGGDKTACQ